MALFIYYGDTKLSLWGATGWKKGDVVEYFCDAVEKMRRGTKFDRKFVYDIDV